jgi:hypothetical protein
MADYYNVSAHNREFSVPMDELHDLTVQMFLGPPVHVDTVRRIERHLGASFCPHYVRFVTEIGDGGAGVVGDDGWLELARVGDLPRFQKEYRELAHVARHTVFGGTGAGEAFAFDPDGRVLAIPHLGAPQDAIAHRDFTEFLRRLGQDRVFDR